MSTNRCDRCDQPAFETCDDGFCSACWEPDEVTEVLMTHALDVAMGNALPVDGPAEAVAYLGREMTAEELDEWEELLAEARAQVADSRAMRSRHVFGLDSLALVRGAL